MLSLRARWLVSGTVDLRFEWNKRSELLLFGLREFQPNSFPRFIEQGDALALGIACSCRFFTVIMMAGALLFMASLAWHVQDAAIHKRKDQGKDIPPAIENEQTSSLRFQGFDESPGEEIQVDERAPGVEHGVL